MNGKTFVEELSVAEQKYYSLNNGASKVEIAKNILPKETLRFDTGGVLIQE